MLSDLSRYFRFDTKGTHYGQATNLLDQSEVQPQCQSHLGADVIIFATNLSIHQVNHPLSHTHANPSRMIDTKVVGLDIFQKGINYINK